MFLILNRHTNLKTFQFLGVQIFIPVLTATQKNIKTLADIIMNYAYAQTHIYFYQWEENSSETNLYFVSNKFVSIKQKCLKS